MLWCFTVGVLWCVTVGVLWPGGSCSTHSDEQGSEGPYNQVEHSVLKTEAAL